MADPTVVLLPGSSPQHAELRGRFLNGGFGVLTVTPAPGPDSALATRVCAALATLDPAPPLVLVAFGSSAELLPAVARAQHAAHRRVVDYLLVDAPIPPVSDAWPDAPVTLFTDEDVPQATLRGWQVRPLSALSAWTPAP